MIEKMRWESMILLPEGEIKKHPHHPPPISPFLDLKELNRRGTTQGLWETTRLELAFDVIKSKCVKNLHFFKDLYPVYWQRNC